MSREVAVLRLAKDSPLVAVKGTSVLLTYLLEQLVTHIFDILMWFLVAYGLTRGDRGWLVLGVIVGVVLIMSYVGQALGGLTQEGLVWMLTSAVLGTGIGAYFGFRSRRRLRQPTDANVKN